jgi:hypothetical protein
MIQQTLKGVILVKEIIENLDLISFLMGIFWTLIMLYCLGFFK